MFSGKEWFQCIFLKRFILWDTHMFNVLHDSNPAQYSACEPKMLLNHGVCAGRSLIMPHKFMAALCLPWFASPGGDRCHGCTWYQRGVRIKHCRRWTQVSFLACLQSQLPNHWCFCIYTCVCVKSMSSMMIHFTDDENIPTAFKPSLTIVDVRQ
jgi:hypothetical protein